MKINRISMHSFLCQIFKVYDDNDLPELTKEGFGFDIENMKKQARTSGELLELKLTLEFLMQLNFENILEFIPSNDHFEEEEDIKTLLNLALESDWQELGDIAQYQLNDITFIDVPLQEWRPQKIKEAQAKERGSKE